MRARASSRRRRILFHVVLEGRYDEGLAVLPWTLAGCVWYGIYCIAQNYLWCAEKTRLATTPLGLGLVANVLLNFALLPAYGLHGAVLATAISTLLCLMVVLLLSRRHGMRVDAGTWLLALSPVAIGFGAVAATAVCSVLAVAAARHSHGVHHGRTPRARRLRARCRRVVPAFPQPPPGAQHMIATPMPPRMPLRVLFLTTSMPVGGAETLLMNLVRRMDRKRFAPEIVCLKDLGPLGEQLACEMRVHSHMLSSKYDMRVLAGCGGSCVSRAEAVITVGAGDKMFWGRLAARLAGVPVIASALHSTGWPDGVGRLNRMLTPLTDAFIGVAAAHGRHLVENERFPEQKVHVIYNGVDTERFAPRDAAATRQSLGIPPEAPVVGILAALRPEKNHELFLAGAKRMLEQLPQTHFIVIGDGPRRTELESLAAQLGVAAAVHFLGTRSDVPELLAACDVVALTSHNEAAPVSILEALAVAPPGRRFRRRLRARNSHRRRNRSRVPGRRPRRLRRRDARPASRCRVRADHGRRGSEAASSQRWSLDAMVQGYEDLIEGIYAARHALRRIAQQKPVLCGSRRSRQLRIVRANNRTHPIAFPIESTVHDAFRTPGRPTTIIMHVRCILRHDHRDPANSDRPLH